MAELSDARQMLEAAEQAAMAGDLASADELLRNVARIQEAELGPDHPELASTLTNLAIVAEKGGWPGDAEAFYRRAAAIAAASLPPDHPIVTASRQNLEDFCRAGGLRIDPPAVAMPPVEHPARDGRSGPRPGAESVPDLALDTDLALDRDNAAERRRAAALSTAEPAAAATVHRASAPPPASRSGSPSLRWLIIGAVVLAAVALFAMRQLSTTDSPPAPTVTTAPPEATVPREQQSPVAPPPDAADPPAAQPAEPGQLAGRADPAAPAPAVETPPVASPPTAPGTAAGTPGAPADTPAPRASASGVTLATADLCRTLTTGGGTWRCDPAGDTVAAGRLNLYTRVKSARDTSVVHRWYKGDTLQHAVTLRIGANPSEGYRTYSRATVDAGAEWRVEARSADGELLYERRFTVR